MTTPRLRPELQASPADDQGIKFFDVSDPRSGAKMRLYDFEWLLASQMDGKRPLAEIAKWAKDALRVDVSPSNLDAFAKSLSDLGFFEAPESHAPPLHSVPDLPAVPELDGEEVPLEMGDVDDGATTQQHALPASDTSTGFSDEADTTVRASHPGLVEATRIPPPPAEVTKQAVVLPPPTTSPGFDRPTALVEPIRAADATPEKKSGSGSIIGLIIVLLLVGAVVLYMTVLSPGGAKVSIVVAKPSEVVRLYEGASKLAAAPSKSLSFGEAGKVLDVVAAGTAVKTGMALATLDAFTKVEKELTDVKDRLGFYQKQADAALAKNDEAGKKAADAKVAEKQKLLNDLEARASKLRITAVGPGTVDKVLVTAGGDAKADEPAIQLDDKRMMASFKIPADSPIKAGDDVSLQRTAGGGILTGKAAKIEDGTLSVEVGDESAAGAEVRLVKSRLPGVITLPASSVVAKNGGNVVYTLADGTLHEKKVTIADRTPTEVYVSAGVGSGDSVVTTGAATFTDGQKAAVAQ